MNSNICVGRSMDFIKTNKKVEFFNVTFHCHIDISYIIIQSDLQVIDLSKGFDLLVQFNDLDCGSSSRSTPTRLKIIIIIRLLSIIIGV